MISIREKLIIQYILQYETKWNWVGLSSNPNITYNVIQAFPDKQWCWRVLSDNHNINVTNIPLDVYDDIDWLFLSVNPTLTINFVLRNIHRKWYWKALSKHPNISFTDIIRYSFLPWDWTTIYRYHATENNKLLYPYLPWQDDMNIDITHETCDISEEHLDHMIQTNTMMYNYEQRCLYSKTIDISIIFKYKDRFPWVLREVCSSNTSLKVNHVVRNRNFPWDYDALSKNYNLDINDIIEQHDLPWNWGYVSHHPNINIDHILQCPKLNSNIFCIYGNISFKDIWTHPDFHWNWKLLSFNKHLLSIEKNDICKYVQQNMCATIIQKTWFRAITNPKYQICKKRLALEIEELSEYHHAL